MFTIILLPSATQGPTLGTANVLRVPHPHSVGHRATLPCYLKRFFWVFLGITQHLADARKQTGDQVSVCNAVACHGRVACTTGGNLCQRWHSSQLYLHWNSHLRRRAWFLHARSDGPRKLRLSTDYPGVGMQSSPNNVWDVQLYICLLRRGWRALETLGNQRYLETPMHLQ